MANASAIIDDTMTLEEKLAAIDAAMANAQAQAEDAAAQSEDGVVVPVDPQDFLMCQGCQ
jgi:hypothetical protein